MINEYEELKKILQKLEELEEAKKHIPIIKNKSTKLPIMYIGKKFNMLTVLEKTDMRTKYRQYTI